EAWCWGNDAASELGDGQPVSGAVVSPVPIVGGRQFESISLGNYHACAVTAQGDGWCWGQSIYGKLGNATYFPTAVPVAVVGGHPFRSISPANNHTCGIDTDGKLFCWGWNYLGQLGTGRPQDALIPVEVAPLK